MDPEATLVPLDPELSYGTCSIRESCCPAFGNETVPEETCEQLCMVEMNPLEHYTVNLGNTYEDGVRSWVDVLRRCESSPADQKFCRFVGQYSTDRQIWGITGEFDLFSNTSSPGSRFCLDQSAVDDGSILIEGDVVIFRTMAPRTSNNIFHPIAQGKNSIGFGKFGPLCVCSFDMGNLTPPPLQFLSRRRQLHGPFGQQKGVGAQLCGRWCSFNPRVQRPGRKGHVGHASHRVARGRLVCFPRDRSWNCREYGMSKAQPPRCRGERVYQHAWAISPDARP